MKRSGRKIYVTTDLEGVSGVWRFAQTRDRASPLFAQAAEYLMGDLAALVRGLRAGGAGRILVEDGHAGGDNFIPHLMEPGASYLTGKPRRPLEGLDRTFHGVVLLGYHAMKGTPDGVLNHTQCSVSESRYWYNGVESGEIAQIAIYAGSLGVPVLMVTGDDAACREARNLLGDGIVAVSTKQGLGREAARLFPFAETRQAIFDGARAAMGGIGRLKPYRVKTPILCRREWIERADRPSETRVQTREATVRNAAKILEF